ncbi:heme lyase CcmF/NrfE family subunit [Adlercreutzia faecimuris]|uniref:Cytochrome c biogenesis protein CcsA n=1 Tax=Adlercreutzia faecimuris TaxID=2897341 RepID=A0ABS9WFA9_9ACTN|nr:cytochrome c biogenesis protein CcsA [Adlercreutzia sp. JBNU-10]MCI2241553.1 cytochrome c biogenesis protein CcsA [Adlercreutzia sp. JBNU-10]
MAFPLMGLLGLLIAFASCLLSLGCLGAGRLLGRRSPERGETLAWGGRVAVVVGAIGLTFCCAILVWCFFAGDVSIEYVVRNRSDATGELGWLFHLAGLWAGRQGSLLFWAWLIAVFNLVVVLRTRRDARPLDDVALLVAQVVLTAFVGVLLFSEGNMPFTALDPRYVGADGQLTGAAALWGMNALLEHWAMAIHPPTLFVGYAGLTVPFAYAIAALVVNDDSPRWVVRCTPYAVFSWLLLGIGIGLGAVWAYVVLGWGGYWGWDPVENASLLPWLVGVALIHSFTVYRQRGAFKRWSVMCACLTFAFVILGTFITRSGLVQSVHAFEGDPVSLVLFLALIVASLLAGAVGLIARRGSFGAAVAGGDDIESMASKEAAYYVNNLVMVVFAVLLAYLTVSSALPAFLPFGGQAISAGTYNAVARPLGIAYCALIAVCPLLGWHRTDRAAFWRRARVPGICAIVLFAVLMAYFATYLLPSYDAIVAAGGSGAEGLLEQGPGWYYNGLAVVGFAVASLLLFNAGFMAVKVIARAKGAWRTRFPALGGAVCHLGMAVVLVGLIGSSMYVTEKVTYLPLDADTGTAAEPLVIQDFELVYVGGSLEELENGSDILNEATFDVYRDGAYVGSVSPAVQMVKATMQTKQIASVISFPLEDLFVVYRGASSDGALSMDVRVNPLISLVWVGFGLIVAGGLVALLARRSARREADGGDGEARTTGCVAPIVDACVPGAAAPVDAPTVPAPDAPAASDAPDEPAGDGGAR